MRWISTSGRAASRAGLLSAVASAIALVAPAIAHADTRAVTDGNDVSGRLDIRTASQTHARSGAVVHTLSTHGPWRSRLLTVRSSNFVLVDFDTAGDRRPERLAFVIFYHRSLRVAVVTRRGHLVGWGRASRPSARSVRVAVPRRLLGSPLGYRWKAFSSFASPQVCLHGCFDRIPNRGSVLHDITPPSVTFAAMGVPASTTTHVRFGATDLGGAGLRGWTVQERPDGGTWSVIAAGASAGAQSVEVTRAEGQAFEYRVIATDGAGSATISPVRRLVFPIDDANAQISYTGTWATDAPDSADYLGTIHTSSDTTTPASFSFTFQGTSVAILARGSCGSGAVVIDGVGAGQTTQLCDNEHRAVVFAASSLSRDQPHTLTLSVDGGAFGFDGLIVRSMP